SPVHTISPVTTATNRPRPCPEVGCLTPKVSDTARPSAALPTGCLTPQGVRHHPNQRRPPHQGVWHPKVSDTARPSTALPTRVSDTPRCQTPNRRHAARATHAARLPAATIASHGLSDLYRLYWRRQYGYGAGGRPGRQDLPGGQPARPRPEPRRAGKLARPWGHSLGNAGRNTAALQRMDIRGQTPTTARRGGRNPPLAATRHPGHQRGRRHTRGHARRLAGHA